MATDWLRYLNQGATRSLPLSPDLVQAMSFLPELGVGMEVFSGGQHSNKPGEGTGSTRHNDGRAGDVFFTKGGRRLDWRNPEDIPVYQEIVRRGKAGGVTGWGAGEGYMQPGSVHLGFGAPVVWGRGGSSANAPAWLREAYGAASAGSAPSVSSGSLGGTMASAIDPRSIVMAQMENDPFKAITDVGPKRGGLVGDGSAGGGQAVAPGSDPSIPPIETATASADLASPLPGTAPVEKLSKLAQLFKVKPVGQAAAAEGQALPLVRRA